MIIARATKLQTFYYNTVNILLLKLKSLMKPLINALLLKPQTIQSLTFQTVKQKIQRSYGACIRGQR